MPMPHANVNATCHANANANAMRVILPLPCCCCCGWSRGMVDWFVGFLLIDFGNAASGALGTADDAQGFARARRLQQSAQRV